MSATPILSPVLDPTTVPCPPWCTLPAHHAYEDESDQVESRPHVRRVGDIDVQGGTVYVEIVQEESRRLADGAVGVEWPGIDLTVDLKHGAAPNLTADQAQAVADAMHSAAVVLDEITGGRKDATEACQHPTVAPSGMTTDQCQSCGETWHTLVRAAAVKLDQIKAGCVMGHIMEAPAAQCPVWCNNSDDDGLNTHDRPDEISGRLEDSAYTHRAVFFQSGDDSVTSVAYQWWDGRHHPGDTAVWVNFSDRQCTPVEARQIAARLILAADLIDRTGAA